MTSLKVKALRVIEAISEEQCIGVTRHGKGEKCFPCLVFKIAHSASRCKHPEWIQDTNALYNHFKGQ